MVARRRGKTAEIRRLSRVATEAIERERVHRDRLYKRGRSLAKSGRSVALTSMAGLVLFAMLRKRHDRDDRDADDRRRRKAARRAARRKRGRGDNRILELARLALTTSRLWESAAARR